MLRLMTETQDINVVSDQHGSPTYAKDLAEVTMQIVKRSVQSTQQLNYGIYHFSNAGNTTWFEFAEAIKNGMGFSCNVHPIPSSAYPTPAKRPAYSVLAKEKITEAFGIALKPWQQSLAECLAAFK